MDCKSKLASKYNNLFGVKAGENPQKVSLYTDEYVNGKRVHVRQNFRVYNSWEDSVRAHTQLIVNGTSDQPNRYAQVRNTKNYRDAAKALQKGGYATDPEYAKKIIQLIEKHNLHKYDT
ncbi:glycoside hydrolase family 73 protein [Lactobacillus kalixensis]|uniref:glycoside hydrolase family 73 protein n=1 Tax=Lactobacillus kalixensis TaxID=227944 RepID=UPI0022A8EC9F|nr:glucosaminidase domain-containing protein [Lactobacillus kalixensis]